MLTYADAPVPALACHTSDSASVGLWSAVAAVDDVVVTLLGGGGIGLQALGMLFSRVWRGLMISIHMHISTYVQIYIYTYIHVYIRIYIHTFIHTHHTHTHINERTRLEFVRRQLEFVDACSRRLYSVGPLQSRFSSTLVPLI